MQFIRLLNKVDIEQLLYEFDHAFDPSLSSVIVDFSVYAEKLAKHAIVEVLTVESQVIGFFALYANDLNGKEGYLTQIAILKEHQGKHIGVKLLTRCEEVALCSGMTAVRLEVRTCNQRAIEFYIRNGYSFFENHVNKLSMYMRKDLRH